MSLFGVRFAARGILSSLTAPLIAVAVIGATFVVGSILKDARSSGANKVEIRKLRQTLQNNTKVNDGLEEVVNELRPALDSQREVLNNAKDDYDRALNEIERLKKAAKTEASAGGTGAM